MQPIPQDIRRSRGAQGDPAGPASPSRPGDKHRATTPNVGGAEARLDMTLGEALNQLHAAGLDRHRRTVEQRAASTLQCDGRRLVNFASNDYLGLASDPRVASAARLAAERFGWGAGASPLVCGYGRAHRDLEAALARFEGTESALLFPSGYAANLGAIAALVEAGDAVFCDRLNHASIIDGCRLSGARLLVYSHGDTGRLERMLDRHRGYRRRLIVSDSLFSMDGDLAPAGRLADLAEKYEATLMLDEAHATGVFGVHGRGVAEALGVDDRVPVRVGTLSKSLGSLGGFTAASTTVIDWLVNRSRPYIFSTALPAACCAAAGAALEILTDAPESAVSADVGPRAPIEGASAPGEELLRRADEMRKSLKEAGFDVGRSQSQIIPIVVGAAKKAVALSAALEERGWLVPAIRPPSVPRGTARLRLSLSTAHDESTLEAVTVDLAEIGKSLGLI